MAKQGLTADEFAKWLTPRQSLTLVNKVFGEIATTGRAIMGRIKGGVIQTAAMRCDVEDGSPVTIPHEHWEHLSASNKADWWDIGDIYVYRSSTAHRSSIDRWYYDVRFDPAGIDGLVAGRPIRKMPDKDASKATASGQNLNTEAATAKATSTVTSPPGRPPKDFWEDMVIAATRAILYDDTLKPKTQADVQRWMADWAVQNGHGHPGETALKERARKVFMACRE